MNLAFDDGSMTIAEFGVVRAFLLSRGYLQHTRPAAACPVCGGQRQKHILYSKATGRLKLSQRVYVECPQCKTVEH